jgi:hypothetical protein
MLELRTTRTGQPTAVLGGVWLHSRYDPEREAARYARNCRHSAGTPPPSTLILLGGELGYVCTALSREFPSSRLLVVYYDSAVFSHARSSLPPSAGTWHPGSPEGLPQFLQRQISEIGSEGLRVLEWAPSARAWPQLSLETNRLVGQFLRELRGSLVTTSALGRRWLRNSFYNFVAIDGVRPLPRCVGPWPVVIAASGPSLAESLPLIRRYRRQLLLWALPSATLALCAAGLSPDLVVLTDPGYYAFYHLHGALPPGTPLCMPLSAGTGAWRLQAGVSYFSQDTVFEREILATTGFNGPVVLPSGTVSASALELALRISEASIVLAGLDFRFRDVHSHVRPNAVELLLRAGQSRLAPLHHRLFAHAVEQAPRRSGRAQQPRAGHLRRLVRPPPPSAGPEGLSPFPVVGSGSGSPAAGGIRLPRALSRPCP